MTEHRVLEETGRLVFRGATYWQILEAVQKLAEEKHTPGTPNFAAELAEKIRELREWERQP